MIKGKTVKAFGYFNFIIMIRNNFIITLRTLLRNKGYSLINIAGLTIGITSCILILLFITSELSYDRYHEKSDRIYRVGIEAIFGDSHIFSALTSGAMKDALEYEFSEVEAACRLFHAQSPDVRLGDRSFIEENFFYADPNFFETFSVDLIEGDPATVLSRPNTVVITEETANKYFGNKNPVGKTIRVNNRYDLEITGISENMPHNSHFRYDFLGSIETLTPEYGDYWVVWTSNNLYTYILLNENAGEKAFGNKLQELVYKYIGPEVEARMGVDITTFEAEGGVYRFFIENVKDIHLHSDIDNQIRAGGNINVIYFFSIIAIFILFIACINFMNLATARYTNRAKEVGVRKAVGSTRGQLVRQFLTESVLISFFAMILAMALVEITIPYFNNLTSKHFEISYFDNWLIIPAMILFAVLTGIVAGSYPAFFLSSFKTVNILKGEAGSGRRGSSFRKILVVAQFTITIALLASTFLVSRQLDYWQSQGQGYKKEGVIVLRRAHILQDSQNTFRDKLLKNEGIINASYCTSLPGYDFSGTSLHRHGSSPENLVQTLVMWTDEHYLETLGIELSEGRFFSTDYSTDNETVVINEAMVRIMGLENPTDQSLSFPHLNLISPIAGVIKDVNFESMHRSIRPVTIRSLENPGWMMAIRIDGENHDIPGIISSIEKSWREFAGDAPFVWSFLDDDLLTLYSNEMRTKRIFTIFSLLAVFIACMGLLGMASFTTEKRTKEIGIRKAMGASAGQVMLLLSKEVNIIVIISTLLAWPAAWYFTNSWLSNFAFRIEPGVIPFILASLLTYVIAMGTVSIQSYRAARLNPVDTLRDE